MSAIVCCAWSRVLSEIRLRSRSQIISDPTTVDQDLSHSRSTKTSFSFLDKLKAAIRTVMQPRPSHSVWILGIPLWLNQSSIENFLNRIIYLNRAQRTTRSAQTNDVPRIQRVGVRACYGNGQRYDMLIVFESVASILQALGVDERDNHVTIDHQEFQLGLLYNTPNFLSDGIETVSVVKDVRVFLPGSTSDTTIQQTLELVDFGFGNAECCICRNDLNGPFSTPCWQCKNAYCYDCIKTYFRTALMDFGRFPARCCEVAIHPDAATGILTDDEHENYKRRFEEWLTKKPMYCPVPTCSAFIPPRLVQHSSNDQFECHVCHASICKECKRLAHDHQPCPSEESSDDAQMLEKFGYKQCPKCGTAVGRMYGCSHMQCSCGAHWCWECRRKIEVCNMDPCERTSEEFYEDIEAIVHPQPVINHNHTPTLSNNLDLAANHQGTSETHNLAGPSNVIIDTAPLSMGPQMPSSHEEAEISPGSDLLASGGRPLSVTRGICQELDTAAHTPRPTPESISQTPSHPEASATNGLAATVTAPLPVDPTLTEFSDPVLTPTAPGPDDTVTEHSTELSPSNLDDPRALNWEHQGINFGDEPLEDDPLDIWGCLHEFNRTTYNKVPRYWMTASIPDWWERPAEEREISCLVCWHKATLSMKQQEIERVEDSGEKTEKSMGKRVARRCVKCGLVICRACEDELDKEDA